MSTIRAFKWLAAALLLLWMPFAGPERPLGADFEQQRCLGSLVWHEARGEPLKAQRAVLDVVHHRSLKLGLSPCDVIAKPRQFAWWDGRLKLYDPEMQTLLAKASSQPKTLKLETFRWFYSGKAPVWAQHMKCRQIGRLHFCKEVDAKR